MTKEQLDAVRHSLSHLMSMAVQELYPNVGLGVGPAIDNGFYQDYDLPEAITSEILPKLEKRMKELIKQNIEFKQRDVDFDEAYKLYKLDPYKTEFIDDLKAKGERQVSFYKSDWFDNLCAGPHVASTKEIDPKAFKLTKIAGAYWRGSEKNKMLTRIYGLAFETEKELDDYLKMLAEAEKRDHRKIGKEMDWFVFSDLVGKGLPLWTIKGAVIRRELERFIVDEEIKRGYRHVYTPDIANLNLYRTSGHYPYYKDSMYAPIKIDEEEYMLRPMTCPHHFELYKSHPHSYRELPMRIAELGKLYRYEQSGELTGLIRVRGFCLADAHVIAMPDQAQDEINRALDLIEYATKVLGFEANKDYHYRLSLGDRQNEEKYFKDDKAWDNAENILREVLKGRTVGNYEAPAEAAFYGPKIDIQMKNVLGKEDTAFTVQYDFVMPKRFQLKYTDQAGEEKEPIVIHRSSIGAIERIIAFLIEKYAGALPMWLMPVQAKILPVSDKFIDYAKEVRDRLAAEEIRVELDDSAESLGKKIRNGEKEKTPYLLVIGEKEVEAKQVAVRKRQEGDLGAQGLDQFILMIKKEIKEKK